MHIVETLIKLGSSHMPKFLKKSIKESLGVSENIHEDVHFRMCSPASVPELSQCLFDLQRDGLLEGRSYYEFGLFRGYALWFVQEMTRRLGVKDFHCYGFDSFRGLPASTEAGDEGAPWGAGDFAVSREQVERYLSEFNADFSRISLHEGFFSDELFASFKNTVQFGPAALVLVDCDLYASTVPVLKFIRQYLTVGAIVLFDDYNCFKQADDRGQRRALREFLAEHPDISVEAVRPFGWHGQGFRIKSESQIDVRRH